MFTVYLLESLQDFSKRYVGFTAKEVAARVAEHNSGKSIFTNKHKPWKCVACFSFESKEKAERFERYLKHGSGHASANRHLW